MDVPRFLKAALENKLPVIEKFLSDKNNPDVCDEVRLIQSTETSSSLILCFLCFTAALLIWCQKSVHLKQFSQLLLHMAAAEEESTMHEGKKKKCWISAMD